MAAPIIRKKQKPITSPTDQIREQMEETDPQAFNFTPPSGNFDAMISSGSTLLDLAISGYRVHGGGIPSGIMMEVFGPPGVGKTASLIEMIRSTQIRGGEAWILDPEARMDKSYAETYGVNIDAEGCNYSRPDIVPQIFDTIRTATPKNKNVVNLVAPDSLAAFVTQQTLEGKDKRGQQRAKEFSQGLATVARDIPNKNLILACSNQMRQGEHGDYAAGGMAIKFYSSLRISLWPKEAIDKERTLDRRDPNKPDPDAIAGTFSRTIGTKIVCTIVKSSLDEPYRKATVYLTFKYGIDDIRANLQFNKDVTKGTKYDCGDGKSYVAMLDAIRYVEDNELHEVTRKRTQKLWYAIQRELETPRKPKPRI